MKRTGRLKAQAATEFLAMTALGVSLLAVALLVYSFHAEEAKRVRSALEAHGICMKAASSIGAALALGPFSQSPLALPAKLNGENYSVWVAGKSHLVKVNYDDAGDPAGVGCNFPAANITNSTGGTLFQLARDSIIKNTGGVLKIEP